MYALGLVSHRGEDPTHMLIIHPFIGVISRNESLRQPPSEQRTETMVAVDSVGRAGPRIDKVSAQILC
jgi:hypothetical protein